MNASSKFVFATDFRAERRAQGPVDPAFVKAREEAYQQGLAEGAARAQAEGDHQLAAMADQLMRAADRLVADETTRETAAVRLAVAFARKLAGRALAALPMAAIEEAARECLTHARGAPHLAIRVAEDQVEAVNTLFTRLGRELGSGAALVVLGDPEIQPGDARMEWADGGIVVDSAAREAAFEAVFGRVLGADHAAKTERQA